VRRGRKARGLVARRGSSAAAFGAQNSSPEGGTYVSHFRDPLESPPSAWCAVGCAPRRWRGRWIRRELHLEVRESEQQVQRWKPRAVQLQGRRGGSHGNENGARSTWDQRVDVLAGFAASSFATANVAGGNEGMPEKGDTATFAYNSAPLPSSIASGWSGGSPASVTATITQSSSNDTLTVSDVVAFQLDRAERGQRPGLETLRLGEGPGRKRLLDRKRDGEQRSPVLSLRRGSRGRRGGRRGCPPACRSPWAGSAGRRRRGGRQAPRWSCGRGAGLRAA
jgi:hypothetical protein